MSFLLLAMAVMAALASHPVVAQQKLPITWAATSANGSVAAGASVLIEVTATIDDGWHLYSLTQQTPPDPTRITVADGQPFTLGGKIEAPTPESGFDKAQDAETEYYTDSVAFKVPVSAARTAKPGKYVVHIKATWQACNGSLCIRPQTSTIDVPVQVAMGK